jgi:hypothetical protein
MMLCLSKNGINKKHSVHRLVLSSFSGELGIGLDVRHIDGTRDNNHISNLAWGSRTDNMQDCVKHGKSLRGTRHPNSKLSEEQVTTIKNDSRNNSELARHFGVSQSTISLIRRNKRWPHMT